MSREYWRLNKFDRSSFAAGYVADGLFADVRCCWRGFSLFDFCLFTPSSVFRRGWTAVTSSACDCSGEADDEPALRSRSSSRRFIFLPDDSSIPKIPAQAGKQQGGKLLTIIPLSNSVLDSPSLSEVWYLRPVLIRVCAGTEGTTGALCRVGRGGASEGVWVALLALHCEGKGVLRVDQLMERLAEAKVEVRGCLREYLFMGRIMDRTMRNNIGPGRIY